MAGAEQKSTTVNPPEAVLSQPLIERWANAPVLIKEYPGGTFTQKGRSYVYQPGRYLEIEENQVMDTSEGPWAFETSVQAFERLNLFPERNRLKILERGAGLNILGSCILTQLLGRRKGDYHVIELNKEIVASTQRWKQDRDEYFKYQNTNYFSNLDITISIHAGEAVQVTKELVEDKGERYDFIAADTFPIDPSQKGFNDIEDIDTLKKALTKNGVFTFFPYFPRTENPEDDAHLRSRQLDQIRKHFKTIKITEIPVNPAPHYRYLFQPNGKPVRSLTVITCMDKR